MVHQQGRGVGQIQKGKTDIKTLKKEYGDVRGSVSYWANEYRDRAALNPPDTNTIGQNIQKIKRKRCF